MIFITFLRFPSIKYKILFDDVIIYHHAELKKQHDIEFIRPLKLCP